MTHKPMLDPLDTLDAKIIQAKGWRQGSIFHPGNVVTDITLAEGELLIICTQSCTVVSSRFATDPTVEAMTVKLVTKYNPKSFEATGKHQRKLHLEVINNPQNQCIECDINRRFFFDRQHLFNLDPLQEMEIGTKGMNKLAGWLGRSYTRIALPDILVERLKPEIISFILKCLNEKQTDGPKKGSPIHESVPFAYIDWQPRGDHADLFGIKFIFICEDVQTVQALESNLIQKLEPYQLPAGKNGIRILDVICRTPNTTFLSDLHGFERFSEWDFLSELGAIAHAPPNLGG
ncbi:MAG: hypothetical protein JSR46_12310 [Verrucomicrobia bacterium]|nr:hypothetical protein [Verrucomicrobiota bacterium]